MTKLILHLTERGYVPDFLIKKAALFLSKRRLAEPDISKNKETVIQLLSDGDVAEKTVDANDQHYEVPPEFFRKVLGKRLKYSCSLFNNQTSLNEAEEKMLDLYIQRADIANNQEILDLGCGWGSFSLYAAAKFPESKITSVSNSFDQINYINDQAKKRSLKNIKAIKMDVNNLNLDKQFDRIISIEMFEHLRNYRSILSSISKLLLDNGKVFIHIFCNKEKTYFYEVRHDLDWMTKYFFLGGIMPSKDIFSYFEEDLVVSKQWDVNGSHYSKTSKQWLKNHYENKKEIIDIFKNHYDDPVIWFHRWRIFFLTCEIFFGMSKGNEYFVSHYLFKKTDS
tara:strand:+ start:154 stop:1167 length:1014 start_codon:yes stop_codon:yes gene_type:complete